MSQKTVYACDVCNVEQINQRKGLYRVAVSFSPMEEGRDMDYPMYEQHWCRACCEKKNLVGIPKDKQVEMPKPTLDEFVREIVREESRYFQPNY